MIYKAIGVSITKTYIKKLWTGPVHITHGKPLCRATCPGLRDATEFPTPRWLAWYRVKTRTGTVWQVVGGRAPAGQMDQ